MTLMDTPIEKLTSAQLAWRATLSIVEGRLDYAAHFSRLAKERKLQEFWSLPEVTGPFIDHEMKQQFLFALRHGRTPHDLDDGYFKSSAFARYRRIATKGSWRRRFLRGMVWQWRGNLFFPVRPDPDDGPLLKKGIFRRRQKVAFMRRVVKRLGYEARFIRMVRSMMMQCVTRYAAYRIAYREVIRIICSQPPDFSHYQHTVCQEENAA